MISNAEKQRAFRERRKPFDRVAKKIKDLEDKLYDLHDCLVVLLTELERLKGEE